MTAGQQLAVIDIEELPDREVAARVRQLAEEPFDLSAGLLLRSAILQRAEKPLLVITAHHAAVDLWSMAVIFSEIGIGYAEFASGRTPDLPPASELAVTPADPGRLAELRAWWAATAARGKPSLALPADRPRRSRHELAADLVDTEIAGVGLAQLNRLAAASGGSQFAVLLAALAAVLVTYSDGPDVVVGSMTAGRADRASRAVVGYLAHPLPLHVRADSDLTFTELTQRAHAATVGALKHDGLPFAEIAESAAAIRADGRNPLFDVSLLVHQAPPSAPAGFASVALGAEGVAMVAGGLSLVSVAVPAPESIFDLTVEIAAGQDGTRTRLRYSTEILDEPTARVILGRLADVLRTVAADPACRISELPPDRERVASQQGPAGTARDIVTQILARAELTPDAVAVRQGQVAVSYAGLRAASGALASRLSALGVGPEKCVGVAVPRVPDLVVVLLAILRAGGAYCPLDASLPAARLAAILADADPVLIVTSGGLAAGLAAGRPVLNLDEAGAARQAKADGTDDAGHGLVHPDQLAYVLFTSGSTGRPKSVAVPRRGIGSLADWAAAAYQREDLESVLAGTALTFDLSVFELLVTLALGGTVTLAAHSLDLPRLAEREHVTLLNTVPAVVKELLGQGLPASLRVINLGGEAATPQLVGDLAQVPRARVLNVYGPTEDTVYSASAELDPGQVRLLSIGLPMHGSSTGVIDRRGRPAAAGVPGELMLSGSKLARGYPRSPGLTAERFVPAAGGARAFRTLDVVRRRTDGELIFLGRSDRQIKLRGVRIELNGVEEALSSHPGVREVAVELHRAGQPDACLIAYVVGEATGAELTRWAAEQLPAAEIPDLYVTLGALPRLPNGKLDRTAMRAMPVRRPSQERRPLSPTEQVVARIWADVLELGDPDPDGNFFLDGGHSMIALRLLAYLEKETGVPVSVEKFVETPTIAGLALAVLAGGAARPGPGAPDSDDGPVTGCSPLGLTQETFWLLHSLDPAGSAYHVPAMIRLRGDLDAPRLERALRRVVERRDGLRMFIPVVDGVPRQQVLASYQACLPVTIAADKAEAGEIAGELANQPFDLTAGQAWRARLVRVSEDDHRLIFVAHHAICDGQSLELLAAELGLAYSQDKPFAGPAGSYARWASAQRAWWTTSGDRELEWWSGRLAGLPELALPADRPRQAEGRHPAAVIVAAIPPAVRRVLDETARQESATHFMAVTALIWALLAAQSGTDRFGLGMSVSARTTSETVDLFGCIVNAVVLRADLTGRPSYRELLRRARREIVDALDHQQAPFTQVIRQALAGRDQAGAPLQVMIAAQPTAPAMRLQGLAAELSPLDVDTAKCDLSIMIRPTLDDDVTVAFEYDTALFDERTMRAFADRFIRLACAASEEPDRQIAGYELSSPDEHRQLDSWGEGGEVTGFSRDDLFGVVEAQARLTPDRVAIATSAGALTYAAMIERARLLAAGLVASGVAIEDRVAICHERSADLIVAVLGVLAAGGAYLPIRLGDPAERRAEMMRDAGAKLVLCDPDTATWLDAWDVSVSTVDDVIAAVPPGAAGVLSSLPGLVDDRQLAYVIYTSGSTGRPKGVAVTHREALARIAWARRVFSDAELSGVLAGTSLGFDLSMFEIFGPLASGGTAVLADSVLDLPELAERDRITLLTTVPSALAALLDLDGWPDSVRTVGLGGELLSAPLARRVASLGIDRLVNLYGTTEDSFCSTWVDLTGQLDNLAVVPVGDPLPGSRVDLVDAAMRRVPPGVPGEVICGGVGVSRGYLGRPGLTASVFRPDPRGTGGERCYQTGDRGRWTGSGLEMHGRLDSQVKIRGHRVELGEIESAMLDLDDVAEAVAMLSAWDGLPRITAYVRLHEVSDAWDAIAFRAALRRRLPAYMIPASFELLTEMPRTDSGKIDRQALAARSSAGARSSAIGAALREGTERTVADLWREMLGIASIGRDDRFFDLGGDSLMAARMIRRLAEHYEVELPVRLIYTDDRLASFASDIDGTCQLARATTSAAVPDR